MINLEDIYHFWKNNRQYWISIQNKDKVDKIVYEKFGDLSLPNLKIDELSKISLIGYIIYKDQILRHICRHLKIVDEEKILEGRQECVKILDEFSTDFWLDLEDWELIFCLMPYKHLFIYEKCLETCTVWVKNKDGMIKNYTLISKFFNDTYQKYYSFTKISSQIISFNSENEILKYNPKKICEYYPVEYLSQDWIKEIKGDYFLKKYPILLQIKERYKCLSKPLIISLSGGVDSMVMLFLFKIILGLEVIAVHIVYGNREESEEEFNFIKAYCQRLGIGIYSYRISFLKRKEISREFYEEITREIRFFVYRGLMKLFNQDSTPNVLLGHIRDDVIENIWTNLGRCQHLDNLKKMEEFEIQKGVCICRPFLELSKENILQLSKEWFVPFLKNTTPSWSNRGKFRSEFYLSTHRQFGKEVDDKLLAVANQIQTQYKVIQKLVYTPIINSFQIEKSSFDISRAIESDLELEGWVYLIQEMCHQKLKVSKPSIHSISNFVKRIKMIEFKKDIFLKIQMKREYQFHIFNEKDKIFLKISKI